MRDERDFGSSEGSDRLDHGIVALTDGIGLLLDDLRFRRADRRDLLAFGITCDGEHPSIGLGIDGLGFGVALGLFDIGLGIEAGDLNLALRSDDMGLGISSRFRLLELLAGHLCETLGLVGHPFLLSDLAIGERLHEFVGRNDVTDEGVHRADIVFAEGRRDTVLRLLLALLTRLQEVDDIGALGGIAEVIADSRLEDLGDQVLHASETRDDLWGVGPRDMDDLAHIQVECEAIRGADCDRRQVLVEVVGLGFGRSPVENDIGRGHELDLVSVGIDGIFARIQGIRPDTLLTLLHEIAVLETLARRLCDTLLTDIGNDGADICNRHDGHVLDLDGREPRVDEVTTREDDLLLEAFEAPIVDEGLGILEHVVPLDLLAGDLAGAERSTLLGSDDTDLVVIDLGHLLHADGEERRVDAICAGRNNRDLGTALTTVDEECSSTLKRVTLDALREDATTREWLAITRLDDTDRAFFDFDKLHTLDVELPRPEPGMEARRERVSLVASLTVERDNCAVREGLVAAKDDELLVDDADGVLRDDDHPEDPQNQLVADDKSDECKHPPVAE